MKFEVMTKARFQRYLFVYTLGCQMVGVLAVWVALATFVGN